MIFSMSLPPSLRFSFLSTYTKINLIKLKKCILFTFLLVCLFNLGIQKASLPQGGSQIPRWPPRTPTFLAFTPCVILSPVNRVGLCDWNPGAEVMTGQDITCNTGLWTTAVSILGARPLLDLWKWPVAIAWGHSGGLWEDHEVKSGGLWPTTNRNWGLPLLWGRAWTWVFPVMIQPSEKPWVKPPRYTILILIPRKQCESTSWTYLLFKFLVMCYTAIISYSD